MRTNNTIILIFSLYAKAELPPMNLRRRSHGYCFICKSICDFLPIYLSSIISVKKQTVQSLLKGHYSTFCYGTCKELWVNNFGSCYCDIWLYITRYYSPFLFALFIYLFSPYLWGEGGFFFFLNVLTLAPLIVFAGQFTLVKEIFSQWVFILAK